MKRKTFSPGLEIALGCITLLAFVAFMAFPSVVSQLIAMAALALQILLLLVTLTWLGLSTRAAQTIWRSFRKSLARQAVTFVLIPLACILGDRARDALFLWRLPLYSQTVEAIKVDLGISDLHGMIVPDNPNPPHIGPIFAKKRTDGVVTVEFVTGGGFPVKHSGFLYQSDDDALHDPENMSRHHYLERIRPSWFTFTD